MYVYSYMYVYVSISVLDLKYTYIYIDIHTVRGYITYTHAYTQSTYIAVFLDQIRSYIISNSIYVHILICRITDVAYSAYLSRVKIGRRRRRAPGVQTSCVCLYNMYILRILHILLTCDALIVIRGTAKEPLIGTEFHSWIDHMFCFLPFSSVKHAFALWTELMT